jgi:hypothetical protein
MEVSTFMPWGISLLAVEGRAFQKALLHGVSSSMTWRKYISEDSPGVIDDRTPAGAPQRCV